MKLVDNWKSILAHAWSMRLMFLAAILSAGELVLPMYADVFPRHAFAALSALLMMAAMVARLLVQNNMGDKHE